MKPFSLLCVLLLIVALTGCSPSNSTPQSDSGTHSLAGAWLARDGTLFHFRTDGTFHGVDFRGREIWGNWVTLSEVRIGFQSLLHDSYYAPQYAIIRKEDPTLMDYIVTGGTHFIPARRMDPAEAEAMIQWKVADKIHLPK